jgi:hypothetical protein
VAGCARLLRAPCLRRELAQKMALLRQSSDPKTLEHIKLIESMFGPKNG